MYFLNNEVVLQPGIMKDDNEPGVVLRPGIMKDDNEVV